MHTTVHPHRRPVRRWLTAVALAAATVAGLVAGLIPGASADDAEPAAADAVPAGSPGVIRYFGRGAYEGIRAGVATTPRSCELSDDTLTALVMAPIFKEVSMAETPQTAPSPMTLSRWDEWSGRYAGSNNLHANYGLYAFRDPNTPYRRAYWTPGVGIFQYDVAGVGAPFTAAEMMNVEFTAGDVAAGMASRYCAARGDGLARRAAAWKPWGALGGIAKSEALFQEMLGGGRPPFSTVGLVDGIENTGGMERHTCVVAGKTEVACWYVNPAAAQGANWWATRNVEGGAPASGEAPLTAPFYVLERNGYEERHWLAQDTGYDRHISAQRLVGQNARPRDGQPQSGLLWYGESNICDLDRPGMRCARPDGEPKAAAAEPAAPEAEEPATPEPETEAEQKASAETETGAGSSAAAPRSEGDDAGSDGDRPGASALWDALVARDSVRRADGDGAAVERRDTPRPNSTFSFARGLALIPPASR